MTIIYFSTVDTWCLGAYAVLQATLLQRVDSQQADDVVVTSIRRYGIALKSQRRHVNIRCLLVKPLFVCVLRFQNSFHTDCVFCTQSFHFNGNRNITKFLTVP